MPIEITVYEFREAIADSTRTLPHVVKADLGQVERLIPISEFGRLFGGYVIWDPPSAKGVAGSSVGVWGLRNTSRFRRLLRERGAVLHRVEGPGPDQRVARIARIRDRASSEADERTLPAELRERLDRFLQELGERPADLASVRAAMIMLLEYLATPEGRTDANCRATDFSIGAENDWQYQWPGLPESYTAVVGDMAGALHDAVSAPAIAENFESTPEQLLARARALPVE
jgi:hypothetical protein